MQRRSLVAFVAVALCGLAACAASQSETTMKSTPAGIYTPGTVAEPVDLGLSVKWASHNVGATRAEEYGGLFGWGDAAGDKISTSNADYPSRQPPREISATEYDIAHVKWSDGWRLPTRVEQQELVDKGVWLKTKHQGVAGYSVTGPNGNSIFLPAVGGRIGTKLYYQVDGADYWSGTLADDTSKAYYLYYYIEEEPTVGALPRHYGFAVRAVRD